MRGGRRGVGGWASKKLFFVDDKVNFPYITIDALLVSIASDHSIPHVFAHFVAHLNSTSPSSMQN